MFKMIYDDNYDTFTDYNDDCVFDGGLFEPILV